MFKGIGQFANLLKAMPRMKEEMEKLHRLWELRNRGTRCVRAPRAEPEPQTDRWSAASPSEWEAALGALVIGREPVTTLAGQLVADRPTDLVGSGMAPAAPQLAEHDEALRSDALAPLVQQRDQVGHGARRCFIEPCLGRGFMRGAGGGGRHEKGVRPPLF